MSPPTQYRLYGRQFYRSKTQLTVSKYWRKRGYLRRYKSKENPEKANNTKYSNTINRHTYSTILQLIIPPAAGTHFEYSV